MKFSSFLLIGGLLLLFSCEIIEDPGKIKAPEWNPAFASAILNTEVSFQDALDMVDTGDYLEIDSTGALVLVYEGNLVESQQFDLISLPDFAVPMLTPAFDFPFPITGIEEVSLKQGVIEASFESTTDEAFKVDFIISPLYENGESYRKTVGFFGSGTHHFTIQLAGKSILPDEDLLHFEYHAYKASDSSPIDLDEFEFAASNLEFDFIQGNFASQSLNLSTDSLHISVDSSLRDLDFSLAEPDFTFSIRNSFGVPLEFKIDKLQVFRDGEAPIDLQSQELKEGLVLGYPTASEVGTSKMTHIRINKDNSNIAQALSMVPDGLTWSIAATLFPDSAVQTGFLLDSSSLGVDLKARLPIKGSLGELEISQIIEAGIDEVDLLTAAGLRLLVENEIPLGIALQVYFLNENEEVQDSVFDGFATLLEAAPVGPDGFVSEAASSSLDVDLDKEKLQKLFDTRFFRIKARISTTDKGAQTVQFASQNKLRIKIGVRGEASFAD